MNYRVLSLQDRFDLFGQQDEIGASVWPEFMLHNEIALNHWMQLIDRFKAFQIMMVKAGKIMAVINSVPLHFDKDLSALPDRGVEWGILKALDDYDLKRVSNTLMAVQIVMEKSCQGKGLSPMALAELLNLARSHALEKVIIPLRPNGKQHFPLIPMEDYISWQNADGSAFDPWLRVNLTQGGKLIKICSKSMIISGTVEQWTHWTKQTFPGSGEHLVPGALNPVTADLDNNMVCYVEPNLWIVHKL